MGVMRTSTPEYSPDLPYLVFSSQPRLAVPRHWRCKEPDQGQGQGTHGLGARTDLGNILDTPESSLRQNLSPIWKQVITNTCMFYSTSVFNFTIINIP
jgi:hypothetical protein